MNTYNFGNIEYYLGTELMKERPKAFVGSKNPRVFATSHKLSKSILYARQKRNNWIETDGSSCKFDKLFISKKWFDKNYPSIGNNGIIEQAPPLILLEDHEKFILNNGETVDIEMRGERKHDKCYFSVKDLQEAYGLKNIYGIIIDKRFNGYQEGTHYSYFLVAKNGTPHKKSDKELFLTYLGVLRILFASRKVTGDKFILWATKTLFTAQMGTSSQKTLLVSNLLGVSYKSVVEVFNKNVSTIPCIYLFSIGKVKDLRKKLSIGPEFDNNDFVYKWGMTIDLERRTKEHQKSYSKISKSNIELVLYGFIDPQYVSEAETKIAHLFENFDLKLDNDKYIELAIIPSKKMKVIKESYDTISRAYMGHIVDLVNKIKEKDNEVVLIKEQHKNELMIEKHKNELMVEKYKNDLLQKEIEILKLKRGKKNR